MERSPRSAGVRPRTGASMGRYHTFRSFVISLAIAIAITISPASGFTIARDHFNSPDLETSESKQLEVRYDLKTLNDNETIYNNKTKKDSDSAVISINNTKHNSKQNYSDEKVNEKLQIVNETADTRTNISETNKTEIPSDTTIIILTETASYATTALSASQTDSLETEFSHDLSTTSLPQTSFTTEQEVEYSTVTNKFKEKEIQENETGSPDYPNYTGDITYTTTPGTNNVNNNDVDKSENKTNDFNNDINNFNIVITTIEDLESKVTTQAHFSDQKADQTNTKEESTIAKTDGSLDASTTASSESKTDVILEKASTEMTQKNFTAEVFTTDLYTPTLPSWKKYTTIDRKRTSTEDTTTTEKDMARAETAQTRINLEKVFTNTPITSLEKLRNDLINAQVSTTRQLKTKVGTETILSHALDAVTNTSTTVMGTEIETEPTKLEIVSKRAGYKDNRETTTTKPEEATTTEFSPRVSTNSTEMYSNMYETEVEIAKNKNGSVYESQSQLAEDAIKEELLREETLNNEENAKFFTNSKQGQIIDSVGEIATGDSLSVKPIGQEKKKNTILYAVNPNYKPLKKIDVQQPKQFVRDPDDNSWRNESISSLGIVFKPKNASKSFTQVLKNKTGTELGNLTDKDSKGDQPDLRGRLEKIAEVRKSKKKINKFGDTVYSDYEESSENTHPSREDTTTPMSPSTESIFTFTPPPTSQSSTTEFDLTVNAISREHFDLFKSEKTSPITTTSKPKKFYNLAEYYDSTDEYDADYVNQHKIDLKKFTKAMKTEETFATPPPELLRTQPMREYQPERKATLQYFPPTQKVVQKVNMNDYDTNFNRKVNMYTINKEAPKNVLTASFGTVSPIPTETYEPLNKVTMKAAYTPMYQNDNLDKNLYLTNQPRVSEPPHGGLVANDGNFNRASYVIKHYRDFINEAVKGDDYERSEEYTYTEAPIRGVTVNELAKMAPRDSNQGEEEYEYDVKFRKDVMNRFVDNFNQNSERFKVDFPILYNSSVVHRQTPDHGRLASSSAFMKRLYEVGNSRPASMLRRPCDPHCEKTVELAPAYELHYYVPDEEEKEEMEPRAITTPYRYRL